MGLEFARVCCGYGVVWLVEWAVGCVGVVGVSGSCGCGGDRRGVVMVNCPFHNDKTASMALYSDKHCHCFGCGYHSDIIDVFAGLNGLTVQEALKEMASG